MSPGGDHTDKAAPAGTSEDSQIDLTSDQDEVDVMPEGTMLVPLDAWNKMVNQLGNLHEAGQQLAEARERAAKAETEAHFLRERLRELREQLEPEEPPGQTQSDANAIESQTLLGSAGDLLRSVYSDWRDRRRRS